MTRCLRLCASGETPSAAHRVQLSAGYYGLDAGYQLRPPCHDAAEVIANRVGAP